MSADKKRPSDDARSLCTLSGFVAAGEEVGGGHRLCQQYEGRFVC